MNTNWFSVSHMNTNWFSYSHIHIQLCDHRVDFTKWFILEYKTVKFPSAGTVFDYYIDPHTRTFKPWTNLVPAFEFDPDTPLQVKMIK